MPEFVWAIFAPFGFWAFGGAVAAVLIRFCGPLLLEWISSIRRGRS